MNKFKVRKNTLNDNKDVTINSKEDNGSKENMEKNYIIIRQLFGINNYLKMKNNQ